MEDILASGTKQAWSVEGDLAVEGVWLQDTAGWLDNAI